MNVLRINFVILVFLLGLGGIFAFNVCNVDLTQPWFKVNTSAKDTVLVIDSTGNVFLQGKLHTGVLNPATPSLKLTSTFFFNKDVSEYTSAFSDQVAVDSTSALIVKNNAGVAVASLSGGVIKAKGKVIAQGEQASCSADGLYCSSTQPTLVENRNYYCDITGTQQGSCTYSAVPIEDCAAKPSSDSDGGIMYHVAGTVTDYNSCSAGACVGTNYNDACTSGTQLTEYSTSGSNVVSNSYSCSTEDYSYCSGTNVMKLQHLCTTGACDAGSPMLVQTCLAGATAYGTWSCNTLTSKTQTVTYYDPVCSSGACSTQNRDGGFNTVACSSGQYCNNIIGDCVAITYGTCGAANGVATLTSPTSLCSSGTPSSVSLSSNTYSWTCTGTPSSLGGVASCSAPHKVNGVCGASNNACTQGTLSDIADTGSQYLWNCNGINTGSTASCSLAKCTNQCPVATTQCTADLKGYQTCSDTNGDSCLELSAVTSCGAGNACYSGSTCKPYHWDNDAWGICSSGTKVRNVWCENGAGSANGINDLPNVGASLCNAVGTMPVNSMACTNVCTGSLPANSAFFPGDNTGLTIDRAISLVATNTAWKCEATCNSGYSISGSTCVSAYSWSAGSFGACTYSGGTLSQTRTVQCKNSGGTVVADSFCTGTKPATSQGCSLSCSCSAAIYCTGTRTSGCPVGGDLVHGDCQCPGFAAKPIYIGCQVSTPYFSGPPGYYCSSPTTGSAFSSFDTQAVAVSKTACPTGRTSGLPSMCTYPSGGTCGFSCNP